MTVIQDYCLNLDAALDSVDPDRESNSLLGRVLAGKSHSAIHSHCRRFVGRPLVIVASGGVVVVLGPRRRYLSGRHFHFCWQDERRENTWPTLRTASTKSELSLIEFMATATQPAAASGSRAVCLCVCVCVCVCDNGNNVDEAGAGA